VIFKMCSKKVLQSNSVAVSVIVYGPEVVIVYVSAFGFSYPAFELINYY